MALGVRRYPVNTKKVGTEKAIGFGLHLKPLKIQMHGGERRMKKRGQRKRVEKRKNQAVKRYVA